MVAIGRNQEVPDGVTDALTPVVRIVEPAGPDVRVEPLESAAADKRRSPSDVAGEIIECPSDADGQPDLAQDVPMVVDPVLLLRRAETDHEDIRVRRPDAFSDPLVVQFFPWTPLAGFDADDGQSGMGPEQPLRRPIGHSRPAAEKENPVTVLGGQDHEIVREVDSGHPARQFLSGQACREMQAETVRQGEIGAIQDLPKTRVGAGLQKKLRAGRHYLVKNRRLKKFLGDLHCLLPPDIVNPNIQKLKIFLRRHGL